MVANVVSSIKVDSIQLYSTCVSYIQYYDIMMICTCDDLYLIISVMNRVCSTTSPSRD